MSSDVSVTVNVGDSTRRPDGARVFATILVGVVIVSGLNLWLYVLVAVFAIGCAYSAIKWGEKQHNLLTAEQRRRAELAARADEQHNWVCQGDQRGTYGVAAPQMRNWERLNRRESRGRLQSR